MGFVKLICFITFLFVLDVIADHANVYKIKQCDEDTYYSVIVNNVEAEEKKGKIFVSGSLSSDDDLTAPISASLDIKRYIKWSNTWWKVPCDGNIGSCTYNDLCSYGISQNISCPNMFRENDVPCRCPISKGTYTIKPQKKMYLFKMPEKIDLLTHRGVKLSSIIAGTYWIEARVTSGSNLLSCYQFYIDYDDGSENIETNEVEPFVHLIH